MATIPGGGSTTAIPLALRPLSANVSFRDQAYAALKQAIMDADIYSHPHELRLDERQLSRSLGVSRTPIREAMTLLEQEGFLRTVPRRGIFIIRKTKRQIIEMIEMWAAIAPDRRTQPRASLRCSSTQARRSAAVRGSGSVER